MTHVQELIEEEIKDRFFGNELVVINGVKYIVNGHAIKHALDRSLLPSRVSNQIIAYELVRIYLQNINNILDNFNHQQYMYFGFKFKRSNKIHNYVLVVDKGYEDIRAIISTVWLEEIYWNITERTVLSKLLDLYIRDLELLQLSY